VHPASSPRPWSSLAAVCAPTPSPPFKAEGARSKWDPEALLRRYWQRNPSQRLGDVDEIAGVALMRASPAGGYINGQTVAVDRGHTVSFR